MQKWYFGYKLIYLALLYCYNGNREFSQIWHFLQQLDHEFFNFWPRKNYSPNDDGLVRWQPTFQTLNLHFVLSSAS